MLASMTAFAKKDFATSVGSFYWEIRGVNHRYFEPRFYLPDQFTVYESTLRDAFREQFSRGRFDIQCRYLPRMDAEPLKINQEYAFALLQQLNKLTKLSTMPLQCNALELIRMPGVLQLSAQADEVLQQELLQSFKHVMQQLQSDRQREGQQLQQLLLQRLQLIREHQQKIAVRVPELLPLLRERLLISLQQLKGELNQDRLEQELLYLAHKLDVHEELDRFEVHVTEFQTVIEKGGAVGRRLDFLLQELQREINTLGNKANDKLVSSLVVEIKVLIEQCREQVQNVE